MSENTVRGTWEKPIVKPEGIPESVVNDAQAAARSAGRHLVIAHPARQVL